MKKANLGFTLMEVLVVVAIVGIAAAVGIPSFRTTIQNNRIAAQANDFAFQLAVARSEAVKRGVNTAVCSSADGATCSTSTDWATGSIVFVNAVGAANTVDAGDLVLQVFPALQGGSVFTGLAGVDSIQYLPTGFVTAGVQFTLSIPDCAGNQVRTITVSPTGRASVARAACP